MLKGGKSKDTAYETDVPAKAYVSGRSGVGKKVSITVLDCLSKFLSPGHVVRSNGVPRLQGETIDGRRVKVGEKGASLTMQNPTGLEIEVTRSE